MPPRFEHLKSRTGCQRCKQRKVKCNEVRPRCGACERHDVECVYSPQQLTTYSASRSRSRTGKSAGPSIKRASSASSRSSEERIIVRPAQYDGKRRMLEFRLLHNFAIRTSHHISSVDVDLWARIAPQFAFKHEHLGLLDAIMATSALQLARDGLNPDLELLEVSHQYLERALELHRHCLSENITESNWETVFLTTMLIAHVAFAFMGVQQENESLDVCQAILWYSLANSTHLVWQACKPWLDTSYIVGCLLSAKPDLLDVNVLFSPTNIGPLQPLLEFDLESEHPSHQDMEAYQDTLSYVGLIRLNLTYSGSETPASTSRRLLAMASRCPQRFVDLVCERRPRALVILGLMLEMAETIQNDIWWTRDVAKCQLPAISNFLPENWQSMMGFMLTKVKTPVV